MVTLIWFILSICNVCEFSWLAMFIEFGALSLILIINIIALLAIDDTEYSLTMINVYNIFYALAIFAMCTCFAGLSISPWWLFVVPIWGIIAAYIPGGFSITILIFSSTHLINVPFWIWIIVILMDIAQLVVISWRFSKNKH